MYDEINQENYKKFLESKKLADETLAKYSKLDKALIDNEEITEDKRKELINNLSCSELEECQKLFDDRIKTFKPFIEYFKNTRLIYYIGKDLDSDLLIDLNSEKLIEFNNRIVKFRDAVEMRYDLGEKFIDVLIGRDYISLNQDFNIEEKDINYIIESCLFGSNYKYYTNDLVYIGEGE